MASKFPESFRLTLDVERDADAPLHTPGYAVDDAASEEHTLQVARQGAVSNEMRDLDDDEIELCDNRASLATFFSNIFGLDRDLDWDRLTGILRPELGLLSATLGCQNLHRSAV